MVHYIKVSSRSRTELIDITAEVRDTVKKSAVKEGVCLIFALHTTAAITINEGADPDLQRDIVGFLNKMVPVSYPFSHGEGNSDAHVKSTLVGASESVIIEDGELLLGTWQAIYFCEFDGPRSNRKVAVRITAQGV
jgi:secondary thiamine-phosphate synthase enzyme